MDFTKMIVLLLAATISAIYFLGQKSAPPCLACLTFDINHGHL